LSDTTMLLNPYITSLFLVLGLGVAHGLEPDHLAAMRTMNTRSQYLRFSVGHGLGFAVVAIPIILLFGFISEIEIVGDIIGFAVGVLLLYEELTGREFELNGGGIGVAQGALALTPSKVLVAILAADAGLILGSIYLAIFILISSVVMFVLAVAMDSVPSKASRIVGIALAVTTLIYISLTMAGIIRGL
jgi:hypothetical protein